LISLNSSFTNGENSFGIQGWKGSLKCGLSSRKLVKLKTTVSLLTLETARKIVDNAGLILENGLLKFLYDQTGDSYKTPYACINEPVSFGVDLEEERLNKKKASKEPKTLHLKIRNASKFTDCTIPIKENETVLTLK